MNVLKGEKGTVIVLVAVVLVVLFGFTALAVDGGYLYTRHTRMQDVADSAALAAAMERTQSDKSVKKSAAFTTAVKYVSDNGIKVTNPDSKLFTADISTANHEQGTMQLAFSADVNEVTVNLNINANLFFARVFGKGSTPVQVSATARKGVATQQKGHLVPIAFFWEDYKPNTPYQMTLAPTDGQSGNYGFLNYDDPNQFTNYLANGYGGTLTALQQVETYTGVTAGPVDSAFESRISFCKTNHSPECTYKSYQPDCPRVVVIPIVSDFFESNGRSYVTIQGFAEFFILSYDKTSKILQGYFLDKLEATDVSGISSDFMISSVKLIK